MDSKTLSAARTFLHSINTGANRRLFYPGSGNDVGCSVGLFWNICDSFYLIDPFHAPVGQLTSGLLAQMAQGTAGYMEGMRVAHSSYEDGFIEGSQPCRRYQVSLQGDLARKRLCFVTCGTNEWLDTTPNVRYNVAICKDYAGIEEGVDNDYPYAEIWGRLNRHGIFAETIGAQRSIEAFNFAKYQFYGFRPLFKVVTASNGRIGFGDGFCLFQKVDSATADDYRHRLDIMGGLAGQIIEALDPFYGADNYTPSALQHKDHVNAQNTELHKIMTEGVISNWSQLRQSPLFISWMKARIDTPISDELLFELLVPFRLEMLGSW
ncbi:hypothetical protein HX867_02270 [Pseudomonas gingeri]|uniref:hypothetical protein n=1 Tax=Pseudomonas gingeri TaxID=117681 RepID=UPI0015A2D453|nr:hypothetical protein [Pseudomonas gingeri]NVZ60899.1 hypothetical protein [Pseudomonas gingeri]NVZ78441.1 hypothetical protein [Pseudomonas gingeri]